MVRAAIAKKDADIGDPKVRLQVMVHAAMPTRALGICAEMDRPAVMDLLATATKAAAIRDQMVHLQAMARAVNIGPIQTDHRTHPERRKSPRRIKLATNLKPPFEALVSTRSRVSWSQPPRDRVALI